MTKEEAKKVFEQYNRRSDIVRCPNGKADIRRRLDTYARAAVNLYGIISLDDFVDLVSNYNEKTDKEEVYKLLLPLVLKEGRYGFYKEYIVHYCFFDDFDEADSLVELQKGKPMYIPDQVEFLKYPDGNYDDNNHWLQVRNFMCNAFGISKDILKAYEEIRDYITYSDGIRELGSIFDKYNIIFDSEAQIQTLIEKLMLARNNTRIWDNKGFTPTELHKTMTERKNVIQFPTFEKIKVGRNDPCPCGSGKKYKKCCGGFDITQAAQLSPEECRLFYETWYGLLGFVNEQKNVIKANIMPEYPNSVNDVLLHKVREVLWENPELIDEYIEKSGLTREQIDILKLWRTKHRKGMFFLVEYQPEYAVAIAPNEQGEDRLYGIKGLSQSVANVMKRALPSTIETVLLPFKGKIIYDSYISSINIGIMEGAREMFRGLYDKALIHGIITSFE